MQKRLNSFDSCKTYSLAATVLLVAAQGFPAHAATQGSEGNTSTGSVSISVTKEAMAKISGFDDMQVSLDNTDVDFIWTDDLCIYSNRASRNYRIIGIGSNVAGGEFILSNGSKTLPYQVFWNADSDGNLSNDGIRLTPGQPAKNLQGASNDDPTCSKTQSAANARLIINIATAVLQANAEGHYSESLTLLVAPD